jgi:hypothetical protein
MAAPALARADESAAQRGERLFEEARTLMAAGRAREACPKFEESDRLDPGGGTVLNLALCYEETGRFVAARAALLDALDRAVRQHRKDREDIAREHLASVERRVATIVIRGRAAPHARIDRVHVDAAPGGRVLVDPGAHVVELVPGRSQTISLAEGEVRTFDVDAVAPPPAPMDNTSAPAPAPVGPSTSYSVTYNPLPFVLLAVAIVGSGVASYGLIRMMREDDDGSGKWIAIGGSVAMIGGTLGALVIPFTSAKKRTDAALVGPLLTF